MVFKSIFVNKKMYLFSILQNKYLRIYKDSFGVNTYFVNWGFFAKQKQRRKNARSTKSFAVEFDVVKNGNFLRFLRDWTNQIFRIMQDLQPNWLQGFAKEKKKELSNQID